MNDIASYSGSLKQPWLELVDYMFTSYKARPNISYSGDPTKPGWNIKFTRGNLNFGTWYPVENSFDVMFVWSQQMDSQIRAITSRLKTDIVSQIQTAEDFMTHSKFIIIAMDSIHKINDYKLLCSVKNNFKTTKGA
jgi:hypothetical protein